MSTRDVQCGRCKQWVHVGYPHYCPGLAAERWSSAVPVQTITEDDVRRIVREELAAALAAKGDGA